MRSTKIDILLVEDRKEDAELCIMALKKYNLANNYKWVKDGQEALDFLFCKNKFVNRKDSEYPKVILLDIKMPKVNGLEVLKQVKANVNTKKIPIVMLTTSKDEQDLINAYNLGVNSYVLKPVGFDDFLKKIKELGFYWLLLNESITKIT